jgi:hypothetical protein
MPREVRVRPAEDEYAPRPELPHEVQPQPVRSVGHRDGRSGGVAEPSEACGQDRRGDLRAVRPSKEPEASSTSDGAASTNHGAVPRPPDVLDRSQPHRAPCCPRSRSDSGCSPSRSPAPQARVRRPAPRRALAHIIHRDRPRAVADAPFGVRQILDHLRVRSSPRGALLAPAPKGVTGARFWRCLSARWR